MLLRRSDGSRRLTRRSCFRANATDFRFLYSEEAELTLLPASGFNQDRNDERNDERKRLQRSARGILLAAEGKMEVRLERRSWVAPRSHRHRRMPICRSVAGSVPSLRQTSVVPARPSILRALLTAFPRDRRVTGDALTF